MRNFVLLLLLSTISVPLFSKDVFYAVYVIDNENKKADCASSLFAWQNRMNRIRHYAGVRPKERILAVGISGAIENWTRDDVLAALDDIHPDSHDTVMFFFAGRSVSIQDKTERYPAMMLQNDSILQLEEVAVLLSGKKPGLLLVLADYCDLQASDLLEETFLSRAKRSVVYGNYRRLFRENHHTAVIASSCFAGQNGEGGVFTSQFMAALDETTASGITSWRKLLEISAVPAGHLRRKICWDVIPQRELTSAFPNASAVSLQKAKVELVLPEWTDAWDKNWYDDQEWYDDGGWNGELYDDDDEFYAEEEIEP